MTAAVERTLDNEALAKQNDLIQMASNLSSGRDRLTDPYELLAELRDAQNETFESEDDEALGRAIKLVEAHVDISSNWDALQKDEEDILLSFIDGSDNKHLKETVYPHLQYKFTQSSAADGMDEADGVAIGRPSSLQKEAAHRAYDAMQEDMQRISRNLLTKYHSQHPDATEREQHWNERGEADLRKELVEQMRKRAGLYTRIYNDHMRWSDQQQKERRAEQLKLGMQLRKAENVVTSIEGQLESHLRDIGGITNRQIHDDNYSQSGAASAAQFWTGPHGASLKRSLEQTQRLRQEEVDRAIADYRAQMADYKEASKTGDLDRQKEIYAQVEISQNYLRNTIMLGDGLDWRQWIDESGNLKPDYNLNIVSEGEETLEIPFNIVEHQLSANNHLLFTSWGQFDDINIEINAAETHGEWEFSSDAKGFFKIWKLMHGKDINPLNYNLEDPKQAAALQEAHADYDEKMRGQLIKFMARRPQDMPEAASQHITNHVVAEFLGSDETQYQNTTWNFDEKDHIDRFMQHNQIILNGNYNIEDGFGWEEFRQFYGTVSNGQIPVYRYEVREANEEGQQLGPLGKWWRDFQIKWYPGSGFGFATGRVPIPDHLQTYYTIESGKQRDGGEGGDSIELMLGQEKMGETAPDGATARMGEFGDIERTQEALDARGLDFNAVPRRDRIGQQHILAQVVALAEMGFTSPQALPDMEKFWVPFGRSTDGTGLKIDPDEFKARTEHYVSVLSGGPEMNSARAKALNLLIKRSGYTKSHYGDRENVFGIAPLTIPHKKQEKEGHRLKPWGARSVVERLHLQGLHEGPHFPGRGKVPDIEQTISPDGYLQGPVEQMPPGPDGVRYPSRLTEDSPWVHNKEPEKTWRSFQDSLKPEVRQQIGRVLDALDPSRIKARFADLIEGANKRQIEETKRNPKQGETPEADKLPTVPEILEQLQNDIIQDVIKNVPKPKITKPKDKK